MACYFVLEVQKQHTIILVSSKNWIKTWLISCVVSLAKWADGIYLPSCLKSTHLPLKIFSITPFLPYLMLALINPVYLLLTGKTNGAGILIIIYIKSIYQNVIIHKLTFTLSLQSNWKPKSISFIKPDYLTHSVTAIIYIYDAIHPSLICTELWGWLKYIGYRV